MCVSTFKGTVHTLYLHTAADSLYFGPNDSTWLTAATTPSWHISISLGMAGTTLSSPSSCIASLISSPIPSGNWKRETPVHKHDEKIPLSAVGIEREINFEKLSIQRTCGCSKASLWSHTCTPQKVHTTSQSICAQLCYVQVYISKYICAVLTTVSTNDTHKHCNNKNVNNVWNKSKQMAMHAHNLLHEPKSFS